MGNRPTLITSASPIYLVDESCFLFLLSFPLRPTHQRAGWHYLVCVCVCVCVCVWSVCRWLSKWWLVFVGTWCYSGRWVWILRALAQFKSPGLFQDIEDGSLKFKTIHQTVSWTWCSGYDCRLSVMGVPIRNLWIANFRFSLYEICVQNQWGRKTLRSSLRASILAVQVRLLLVRIEYVLAFQIWYCELCVKKTNEGEAESITLTFVLSSFLSVKYFLKIWANHFSLLTFESFKPFYHYF